MHKHCSYSASFCLTKFENIFFYIFRKISTRGDKTYIIVQLPNGKEIEGVGPNKKVAKRSAAKRALAELRKENEYK